MKNFRKLLSVILAVMMVMSVIPVGATGTTGDAAATWPNIPEGATLIFAEDFESGYTTDTNLLKSAGEALIKKNDKDVLKFKQPTSVNLSNVSAMVTDATADGFSGNALKIMSKDTSNTVEMWLYINGGEAIDVTNTESPYYGKQLIFEYDAKIARYEENKFMAISTETSKAFQKADGNEIYVSSGRYATANTATKYGTVERRNWYSRPDNNPSLASKATIRYVVEQMADVDTVRTYRNGILSKNKYNFATEGDCTNYGKVLKDYVGENYAGAASLSYGNISFLYSKILADSGAGAVVYVDNIKVFAVDPIEFDGLGTTTNINPEEGVEVSFDQPFNATADTFKITTAAGAEVVNAITDVTMSADKQTATVKMNFNILEPLTQYKIWIDDEFTSEAGALFYKDHIGILAADEWIELGAFDTCDKLEVVAEPATGTITGYDQGDPQEVVLTFTSPLAETVDIANAFYVVNETPDHVSVPDVVLNEERTVATIDLSTLALGEGIHTIKSKDNAIYNDGNIKAVINYAFDTVDYNVAATPSSNTIKNYVQGTPQQIEMLLSIPTAMDAADLANAFTVEDKNETPVSGLVVTMAEDKKNFVLDISGLELGAGEHTIKSTDIVVDKRGRTLDFEYKFDIMPFIANYPATISEYIPGSALDATITLTYPLSDATVAAIANAFVVKNQYGSNVEGLGVTVSEDKKEIILNLATLDIEGGEYTIASKTDAIVNAKGEILPTVVIDLLTSTVSTGEVIEDNGVAPGSGFDLEGDFTTSVLLSENFDNEDYARDMNWLSGSGAFVPGKFTIDIEGDGDKYVDAEVKIVKDPANPDGDNYVLKNVAGFKDSTGTVMANSSNYHKIKRALNEGATETISVDASTIVKLSTKVYIPTGGSAGIPTGASGDAGNTKDTTRIIALTNGDTTSLNHPNLRRNGAGVPQYNTWVRATDSASGSAGEVSATLATDKWHTIELVFGYNPKSDGSMFKSYEVWVDGTRISSVGGYYAANYETVGGMMSVLASATGGSGTTTIYYDDWTITKTNKLSTHVNVAKADVPETQDITLTFTNKLTAESAQLIEEKGLISVKDSEGNDVKATITLDNTGINTKVIIDPAYGLKYQTQYVVEIADSYTDDRGNITRIVDEYGNVFGGFNYTFETAKAKGTTIDVENGVLDYDADYMHLEDTFTYQMTLSEAATHDIYAAVATFSEDNELLGIKYEVFNTNDIAKTFNVSSDLGAKYIRLYIWDYTGGVIGRLMQIPDEVTSR